MRGWWHSIYVQGSTSGYTHTHPLEFPFFFYDIFPQAVKPLNRESDANTAIKNRGDFHSLEMDFKWVTVKENVNSCAPIYISLWTSNSGSVVLRKPFNSGKKPPVRLPPLVSLTHKVHRLDRPYKIALVSVHISYSLPL